MTSILFRNSKLFISLRSPFARRVRLALLENEIPFEVAEFDVLQDCPELVKLNPLGRVPVLQLADGQILIDSNLILQSLYENIDSPLMPTDSKIRAKVYYWSSIAYGVCEKVVEYFLDSRRPPEKQNFELGEELNSILDRVFPVLEDQLREGNPSWIIANQLTQADLDLGAALGYLDLRFPCPWKKLYPKVDSYYRRLETRASFQLTRPPNPS